MLMIRSKLFLATASALVSVTIAVSISWAQVPASPETGLEIGQPFPTMAFPAIEDGQPRSITEFRGQKLILHIFASW